MPTLQVKTVKAEQVWQSPDKQRTIWELQLEYEGKPVKAQTFSKDIATPGWAGTVETYERGGHTFVKQPPKEDGGYSGSSRTATPNSRSSGYQAKDEKAIQAMWAIGQASQAHEPVTPDSDFDGRLESVERLAQELFSMVDRVKATPPDTEPEATVDKPDTVILPTDDELQEMADKVGGEVIDIEELTP